MAKMSLGSFTFPHNPSKMSLLRPKKIYAVVETYSDIGFFSWGTTVKGIQLTLEWPFMASSTFSTFDSLLQANAEVVFNPQDGSGHTYTSEILTFTGDYHTGLGLADPNTYRKNVKLLLLIKAKV